MGLHHRPQSDSEGDADGGVSAELVRQMHQLVGEVREMRKEVEEHRRETKAVRAQLGRLQGRVSSLLLTREEAAERLSISTRTLRRWTKKGKIEPVEGVPGVRYHPDIVARLAG